MKAARIGLALSMILVVTLWCFLALLVPSWIYPYVNQPVPLPNHLKLLLPLSNYARTPLGLFLTVNLLGLNIIVLIWASLKKPS